jgi:hypothetical protein
MPMGDATLLPWTAIAVGGLTSWAWLKRARGGGTIRWWYTKLSQGVLAVASAFEFVFTLAVIGIYLYALRDGFNPSEQQIVNILASASIFSTVAAWAFVLTAGPQVSAFVLGQPVAHLNKPDARSFDVAVAHFEGLRERLEEEAWGQFAAIDPSGQVSVAQTRELAIAQLDTKYAPSNVVTFRIGR